MQSVCLCVCLSVLCFLCTAVFFGNLNQICHVVSLHPKNGHGGEGGSFGAHKLGPYAVESPQAPRSEWGPQYSANIGVKDVRGIFGPYRVKALQALRIELRPH